MIYNKGIEYIGLSSGTIYFFNEISGNPGSFRNDFCVETPDGVAGLTWNGRSYQADIRLTAACPIELINYGESSD